jgi:hypothetical protein
VEGVQGSVEATVKWRGDYGGRRAYIEKAHEKAEDDKIALLF